MNEFSQMEPAAASERIYYLDVLRGLALFGIVTLNMWGFVLPQAVCGTGLLFHGRADMIALAVVRIFIQAKFLTIFSFLFGLGFAVQMSRSEARGISFMSFYPRRLLVLAMFGITHALLIWWGDILLIYATTGAVLLLFRKSSQKALLTWAICIAGASVMAYAGFFIAAAYGHPLPGGAPDLNQVNQAINTYAHGNFTAMVQENWTEWNAELRETMLTPYALYFVVLFLLGLFVWRTGVINRLERYRPILKLVCAICLPAGILLNAAPLILRLISRPASRPAIVFATLASLQHISTMILSAGYACAIALLIQKRKWMQRLAPFAMTGRMALTNYLMQSIVCVTFFRISGLYGHIGPAAGLIPVVLLYSVQVVFSTWWLKRFAYGPMEWIWRGMTYGKLPRWRKEPLPVRGVAA
jgi:uncharacterized protein